MKYITFSLILSFPLVSLADSTGGRVGRSISIGPSGDYGSLAIAYSHLGGGRGRPASHNCDPVREQIQLINYENNLRHDGSESDLIINGEILLAIDGNGYKSECSNSLMANYTSNINDKCRVSKISEVQPKLTNGARPDLMVPPKKWVLVSATTTFLGKPVTQLYFVDKKIDPNSKPRPNLEVPINRIMVECDGYLKSPQEFRTALASGQNANHAKSFSMDLNLKPENLQMATLSGRAATTTTTLRPGGR